MADTQSYPAEEAAPETRPITLGEAIRRRAEAHPDRPALVSSGYAPLTYSALQSQLDEVQRRMRGAGLGCSARLARLERAARMPVVRMLSKARQRVARGDIRFSTQSWQASYNAAMGRYLPLPLAVTAIFYAAAHGGRAWRGMSPHLEIVEVPGGHIGCLTVHANILIDHRQHRLTPASQKAT